MALSKRNQAALRFWVGSIAVCLVCTAPSRGDTFSDFEAPTYSSNSTFIGVDGWFVLSGSVNRALVTPLVDADTLIAWSIALEGTQSAFLKSNWDGREWNGLESYVFDGLEISWLVLLSKFGRQDFYLSPDVAGFNTPIGVVLEADGDIARTTPNSGLVDSGENYNTNKVYRMTMLVNFTAGTVAFTSQNITDAGAVLDLGTGSTGSITTNDYQVGGGVIMNERDGNPAFYDDIQVGNINIVPPPAQGTVMTIR